MPRRLLTTDELIQALRYQHSDLRQGAIFSPSEDPTWDVTEAAAERLALLQAEITHLNNEITELTA